MSEIREKIAQALFDVRDDEFDLDEWEDLDSTDRERWLCDADAVLPLIRDIVTAYRQRCLLVINDLVQGPPLDEYDRALSDASTAIRAAAYRVGEGDNHG